MEQKTPQKIFKRSLRFRLLKPWSWFTKLEVKLPFYRNKFFGQLFSLEISLEKTATNKWSVFIHSQDRDIFYTKPFESKKEAKRHAKSLISDNSKLWDELQQYHAFYGGLKYETKFPEGNPEPFNFHLTEIEKETLSILDHEKINNETINTFIYETDEFYYAAGFIACLRTSIQRKAEEKEKKDNKK